MNNYFRKDGKIPIGHVLTIGILPSVLKVLIYKLKGYTIGKRVKIGFGSVIVGKDVRLGDNTKVGLLSIIKGSKITLDDFVNFGSFCYWETGEIRIGQDSRIREFVHVGGILMKDSKIAIGKRCLILQNTIINPTKPVVIGNDVGIGGGGRIFTHASWQNVLDGYPTTFSSVEIHNNVWIAWDVFIMPGVTIGQNSTIGAGSVINSNVPSNSLGRGAPFKVAVSGENKWPRKISNSKQTQIVEEIISEYCSYLSNNRNITIEKSSHGGFVEYTFNSVHKLIYLYKPINLSDLLEHKFEYTILNNSKQIISIHAHMVLDIVKKERSGSTELGESLVGYLSHYGIRFSRVEKD